MWEAQPCRHPGQCRRRQEGIQVLEQIPLQPVVKPMVRQAVPCSSWRLMVEQIPTCSCGGPHTRAGGCLKEAVTLRRTHAGAGSWQDLWPCGERSPGWSRFAGRTCDPVEGTHAGAVLWRTAAMGRPHIGEIHGGLFPVGGVPRLEGEGAWGGRSSRNNAMNWLQPPFLVPLHLWGGEVEK